MKKYIVILFAMLGFGLASCDTETDVSPGGTQVEKLAGDWMVHTPQYAAAGTMEFHIYNTATDDGTEIWVEDAGHFWDFKVRAACDAKALTFGSDAELQNVSYDCKVKVTEGKVLLGAATTPSGMPADSIYFKVAFSDDSSPYATEFEFGGFRRTGFDGDE